MQLCLFISIYHYLLMKFCDEEIDNIWDYVNK